MQPTQSFIWQTVFITCLLLCAACSTTTVHVNKLYLSDKQSNEVKTLLELQGLAVEFNELNFPKELYSTTILYSPFVKEEHAVDNIENTLHQLGYDVGDISALVASNHWYTKNTIGLYIVPDGVSPNSGKNIEDIAFEYRSEKCDKEIALTLEKNSVFTYKRSDDIKIIGNWSITEYPYILLENKAPYVHQYFEISRSKRVDKISEIDIIALQPMSSSLIILDCKLTYGERL